MPINYCNNLREGGRLVVVVVVILFSKTIGKGEEGWPKLEFLLTI